MVAAEVPQQAALTGAAVVGQLANAHGLVQLVLQELLGLFRQRIARSLHQRLAYVRRLALPLGVDQQHAGGLLRQVFTGGFADQLEHQGLQRAGATRGEHAGVLHHHRVCFQPDVGEALAEGRRQPPAAGGAVAVEQTRFGQQETPAAGAGDLHAAQVHLPDQLELWMHRRHAFDQVLRTVVEQPR